MPGKSTALHAMRALPANTRAEVIGELLEEMEPQEIVDIIKQYKLSRDVEAVGSIITTGSAPSWSPAPIQY